MKKIYVIGWGNDEDSDVISACTTIKKVKKEFDKISKEHDKEITWKNEAFLIMGNGEYYYIKEVDLHE